MSFPPPAGFKHYYGNMTEEMKVLIPDMTEPSHWVGALLDMWESPEPWRKEDSALYAAKFKTAKVIVKEVNEVKKE